MSDRPTLTSSEAAQILGVSMATVARLVKKGELNGYKLTTARNSPLRIYQDSVDKLLKRRQQPN